MPLHLHHGAAQRDARWAKQAGLSARHGFPPAGSPGCETASVPSGSLDRKEKLASDHCTKFCSRLLPCTGRMERQTRTQTTAATARARRGRFFFGGAFAGRRTGGTGGDLWRGPAASASEFHGRYLPGAEGIPRGVPPPPGRLGAFSVPSPPPIAMTKSGLSGPLRGEILLERVFQRLGGELFQPGVLSQLVFGSFIVCNLLSFLYVVPCHFLQGGSEKCSISRYIFWKSELDAPDGAARVF